MDELSQGFGRALFLAFPNWERLAKDVKDEKTSAHYIEVDVPQEGTDRRLHLSTVDKEITIAFDHWHTHVGPFLGISTTESVATAMTIIESFVTEQAVVKVSRRDGVWTNRASNTLPRPANPSHIPQHRFSRGSAPTIRRLKRRDSINPSPNPGVEHFRIERSAARAPGFCVLRRGKACRLSPRPFLR
jgi:hypothetical protein